MRTYLGILLFCLLYANSAANILTFETEQNEDALLDDSYIMCKDPNFSCSNGTCCLKNKPSKPPSKPTYTCCPYTRGVCCQDNIHCCPLVLIVICCTEDAFAQLNMVWSLSPLKRILKQYCLNRITLKVKSRKLQMQIFIWIWRTNFKFMKIRKNMTIHSQWTNQMMTQ